MKQLLLSLSLAICSLPVFRSHPSDSYHGFPTGYCTSFAAKEFDRIAGEPADTAWHWRGNAEEWLFNAKAQGWRTSTNPRDARDGAIAVWTGGSAGHVGILWQVRSDDLSVKEMNWGPNSDSQGRTGNFGKVTTAEPFSYEKMDRGRYRFAGVIFPMREKSSVPNSTRASLLGYWLSDPANATALAEKGLYVPLWIQFRSDGTFRNWDHMTREIEKGRYYWRDLSTLVVDSEAGRNVALMQLSIAGDRLSMPSGRTTPANMEFRRTSEKSARAAEAIPDQTYRYVDVDEQRGALAVREGREEAHFKDAQCVK